MDYYYFPTSYWSRIVSLALAEKGLRPTLHVVDIRKNASFDPDYVRLNPRGVVPTLVDDGQVVWDGPTIVSHLDGVAGPTMCAAPGTPAAVWARRLEELPIMLFSYSVWVKGLEGEKSADVLADKISRAADYASRYPDLREPYERKGRFFTEFRAQVYDAEHVAAQEAIARAAMEELAELVSGQPYVAGDAFGYADCIATSALYRLADIRKADIWRDDPAHPLVAYYDRVRERPSHRRVFVEDPNVVDEYRTDGRFPRLG